MKVIKMMGISLFVLCLTAIAPQTAYASLIDPDVTGSIRIHSLAVEDTAEHQTPATGEEVEADGEPLANIRYTVTRVREETTDPVGAQAVTGEGAYTKTIATDENGLAVFDSLALGVYLVRQEESAAVGEAVGDFLVDVPMTDPTGTSRIYNVNVYPKYRPVGPPDGDAFVSEPGVKAESVDLQGSATWIVAAQIPGDIGEAQSFQVHSEMHAYLSFTPGSIAVYAEGEEAQRVNLEQDTDYSVSVQERQLRVAIQKSGLVKLGAAPPDAVLYTVYTTTLAIPREDLPQALATRIGIDAGLEYTGSLGRPGSAAAKDTPYVYTGGVGIRKVAGGGQPLEGAAFKIYRTQADAVAGVGALQTPWGDGDWVETTDNTGVAAFSGLAYGDRGDTAMAGSSDYYLVQTAAPAGYNLLRAPVEITVDATSHLADNAVEIQGRSGFLLPATGGMGTVWFTVIGLLLIGLALWLFWRARKKRPRDTRR